MYVPRMTNRIHVVYTCHMEDNIKLIMGIFAAIVDYKLLI